MFHYHVVLASISLTALAGGMQDPILHHFTDLFIWGIHHRPSNIVTDTLLMDNESCLLLEESGSSGPLMATKPGCLGCGSSALSLPNMNSTDDIVGRSSGRS